ncbi:hypothetical protein HMPREF0352_2690 [Enterococcus faecium TX1330]|nr:hypothetical protein HMPREF0352_2690 [Enterococcus faecium TX1330]EEV51702.1 predicted protein [Enterococcus faecium 1,141,733]EJV56540.1 hypothetical protein HMPREF1345_00460 [Enterococcus faecium TX1337RF]
MKQLFLELSKINSAFLFLDNGRKSKKIAYFKNGTFCFFIYLAKMKEFCWK